MKNWIIALMSLSGFLFLWTSCAKNPVNHMTQEESRLYVTNRDSTVDFNSFKTFSIVDSVAIMTNDGQAKELTPGDEQLLQLIKEQMEARGYQLVKPDENPDLGINVTLISYTVLNAVPNPYDYWGSPGYWGGGYWGYSDFDYMFPGSFGYFPQPFLYYNTRSDMVAIDLINLKNVKTNEGELDGIWNASFKGEGVLDPSNYKSMVEAVFEQSPYLKTN